WKSKILKVGCLLALLGVGRLVISNGSREGFFSFLLILFFWFIFTYKKLIRQKPTMFIFLGIIITLVGLFFVMSLADTIMGERLEEGFESTTDSDLLRQNMYIQAIGLTIRNPVLGVGVDNFGVVTGIGTYAHSNYVETSSTTGIPGFVSYYLAFAFLWFRLWRLGKMPLEMKAKTLVNAAQAFMLVRFASDLTRVSYFSKINWIFFAILIGWSYSMEKQLKQDAEYLQEDEFSEPEPYPDESEAQYMET
ncbi:MAG: O-antigen ligase family protein, partial [Planctomycetota bacterium]